jgi:hypothetical protein
MKFKEINISRLIIHKIIGKSKLDVAYSDTSDLIHTLDKDTKGTLLTRIYDAVGKSTRFFETKLEYTESDSFWNLAKDLNSLDPKSFVQATKDITEIAVEAHQVGTRPGGLLVIIDGLVDKKHAVMVIKAELQEALTLNGTAIQLIKELFLSPAKEFYKIGILIHSNKAKKGSSGFETYVYDDNFSPSKKDLAGYFYKDFLGFSTSENDKIQTNAFLVSFTDFVEKHIKDFTSRKNLKIRIKADYRESGNKIVDPKSYAEFFDEDPSLRHKYQEQIISKFPRSFTKDLFLVDDSLNKSTINITSDIKMSGPSDKIGNIDILDPNDELKASKLKMDIEDGQVNKIVVLRSDKPTFKRDDESDDRE